MKFRTDFVTNSSSSSFVTVTVKLKDKKALTLKEDFEEGFGTYIPDLPNLRYELTQALDKVTNGEELMEVLKIHINHFFDCFIELSENGRSFQNELCAVKSKEELDFIELKEDIKYEDSYKTDRIRYKYEFTLADGIWEYKKLKDKTLSITAYNGYETDIIVPEKINNMTVTEIGDCVFSFKKKTDDEGIGILSVTLPDTIRSIGSLAFGADNFLAFPMLEKVNIPEGVTSIGSYAFHGCGRLKEITVTESLKDIGENAFKGCSNLTVRIKGYRDLQGKASFFGVDKIIAPEIKITEFFSDREKEAAAKGFISDTTAFQKDSEVYRENVEYIRSIAEDQITCILMNDNAAVLSEVITAENICAGKINTYITAAEKTGALKCLTYLNDLKNNSLPEENKEDTSENIEEIKKLWAYKTLPDKTLTITNYKGNDPIVIVPGKIGKKTVTRVDDYVFSWETQNGYKTNARIDAIHRITQIILPDSITSIGKCTFGFSKILTLNLQDTAVTDIGKKAFGCRELKDITLPATLKIIGSFAFEDCEKLTGIRIPGTVKEIGDLAFYKCKNLTEVLIEEGVEIIGSSAFNDCYSLQTVKIPASVTEIKINHLGETPFGVCKLLTVYCPKNSCAEAFCKEHGIPCVTE